MAAPYYSENQYTNSDRLTARISLHSDYGIDDVNPLKWAFDHILTEAKADSRVLEIGCGRGDLWVNNHANIPSTWKITLTDSSVGMLHDCSEHLQRQLQKRFDFAVVDAEEIPYPNRTFHVVIAKHMLYHVAQRAKALFEIRRVLTDNGVFIAITNSENHLKELFELCDRFEQNANPEFIPYHAQFFRNTFSVENGLKQLETCFSNIRQKSLTSRLKVPKLQPILDYIASTLSHEPEKVMNSPLNLALTQTLQNRIEREGYIIFFREEGIFTARP